MRTCFITCFFFGACGSQDNAGIIDAPPADAENPARCRVAAEFGDLGQRVGRQSLGPTTSAVDVDVGPPRDTFFLKLVDGKGVFAAGLNNGSFELAGADLNLTTCGLCVNLVADIGGSGPQQFYFAYAGNVTLTSTSPPVGSIANVMMHETTVGGEKIAGGCVTSIRSLAIAAQ